ncbi:hypothetical protein SNE40_001293 [Patella caerulea]|uniref:Uncharacterized protein n=1 Tax=Patella caerulea TaxID=87958 RepID=A0AAN8KFM8_PATCE
MYLVIVYKYYCSYYYIFYFVFNDRTTLTIVLCQIFNRGIGALLLAVMLPEIAVRDIGLIIFTLAHMTIVSLGECEKIHQQREIQIPGYKTIPIHTNACKETTAAYLEPMVDLGIDLGLGSQHIYIKRYHDGCCCAVRNSSEHRVSVERVDGRSFRNIKYRRIDSCKCTQCNLTTAIARHTAVEYIV